ncbi:uncharacterized protein LOC112350989 isoform X1 [Selaginella moellendorffii]|uniref:uncharacterized protein LOC112350989 isoform X1 n=1 Tax=Selaginella moellendorffii TaxID=88036 RepID=UPI000D1CFB96|nr:uncharacterized protein LOC112350989 isoform X1 [Selaginella moellendorffii]|eukprot:XP_024543837.1 uncharacterized protein LOC112350989 isoform X1 [Selaginella moellendorffii]
MYEPQWRELSLEKKPPFLAKISRESTAGSNGLILACSSRWATAQSLHQSIAVETTREQRQTDIHAAGRIDRSDNAGGLTPLAAARLFVLIVLSGRARVETNPRCLSKAAATNANAQVIEERWSGRRRPAALTTSAGIAKRSAEPSKSHSMAAIPRRVPIDTYVSVGSDTKLLIFSTMVSF